MKEVRKRAKDGPDADPMVEMRKRYELAVDADRDNRTEANEDYRFVTVPGNQWTIQAKKARRGRPCWEYPILRSHWRQVCNDQKKARPQIKVRAVEDADAQGAELRQGIIRNIESVSNSERAYDSAFDVMVAAGFSAWRVCTEYSQDDGWEQDIRIRPIKDALNCVWLDPNAPDHDPCGHFTFVEESISREEFQRRYPKAEVKDFASLSRDYTGWFGEKDVRIAEYWRKVPVSKEILLLSDGRSVDGEEFAKVAEQEAAQGVTVARSRKVNTHKVVMSIVSGCEELDGPHDSVFDTIPIVPIWANRHYIDGKWVWAGMVRFSKDPQRLVNYNFTTAQEVLSKQHKATPIVSPKMLEGEGVKKMWDESNAVDTPYLPITPDPMMAGGPTYLSPPPIQNAFAQMGQMAIDMLKASDGIFDASTGARSNETSGKAILARQAEGDTATYDYQDALAVGIQRTGELIGKALGKVYDTPRVMRVIGKDGAEDFQQLYQPTIDPRTGRETIVNDLSAGKYDYTVTTGPSYDTQRMEFVDALVQLGQGNPLIGSVVPDLIVGSMDFPKAEEAAERLKLMLPPQIQQQLAAGKKASPEVLQMQAQLQQLTEQAQAQMAEMQEALQVAEQKAISSEADVIKAQTDREKLEIEWYKAETDRMKLGITADSQARTLDLKEAQAQHSAGMDHLTRADAAEQAQQQPPTE